MRRHDFFDALGGGFDHLLLRASRPLSGLLDLERRGFPVVDERRVLENERVIKRGGRRNRT